MDARRMRLELYKDDRGELLVTEDIPFPPRRVFFIREPKLIRGGHGHDTCEQVIVCVNGKCTVRVEFLDKMSLFFLMSGDAIYVPTRHIVTLYEFSEDCTLAVLCSRFYDPDDYIYPATD